MIVDIFSGSNLLGNFIGWIMVLIGGSVLFLIISILSKKLYIFYFLASIFIYELFLDSYLLLIKKEDIPVLWLLLLCFLSFISLFFSYRKSQNKLKTTGYIILNLILVSLFIFLLNR